MHHLEPYTRLRNPSLFQFKGEITMITYTTDKTGVDIQFTVRQWKFPGGEVGVDINNLSQLDGMKVTRVCVDARIQNSDDVMALLMATDALRMEFPLAKFMLDLPYIPYARQDRVCNAGEALSIKVFGRLINSLQYDFVQVVDPHSAVSLACIDNVHVRDQFDIFKDIKSSFREWTIVAPDQGATKKCEEFAKKVGAAGVITFSKTRELSTGKITGMKCLDSIDDNAQYLVLDDICDGGRTFIELANLFNNGTTLELAVTHGIFSKGFEVVGAVYDHVYTTDSFGPILSGPTLTVIEI
jgi:ribose-phosphate pyrophosphokinase